MADPYGYWTFGGKNGLAGVASTTEELLDGRIVTHKDPDNPAVLEDVDILYALQTSRVARAHFSNLFPNLLPEEQDRLSELLLANKRAASLLLNSQDWADAIQHDAITDGVRTRFVRPGTYLTPRR